MARIPVEQERKRLLWPWVVGLIALLGVLWGILAYGPEEPYENDAVVIPAPMQDSASVAARPAGTAAGDRLTTSAILNANDPLALVGQAVRLEDLRVARVLGDSTFYVTLDDSAADGDRAAASPAGTTGGAVQADRRDSTAGDAEAADGGQSERLLLVVLDEQAAMDSTGTQASHGVNAGQTLTLYGTLMALRNDELQGWGITPREAEEMEGDLIYLRAKRLEQLQQP